jgi:hypothetical protein
MSTWGEFSMGRKRKWYVTRAIEEALIEAEPAAEWLRTHPPGARLPDALEPGYEPDEYQPASNGMEDPSDHWSALPAMYPDEPTPNFDRCPWCDASWPERGNL